jgi:hypothetical protein
MKGDVHYILNYQPGDGTRYDFCIYEDPYGGWIITWPTVCTYRAYLVKHELNGHTEYPEMNFLHGQQNEYTMKAMRDCVLDLQLDGVIE